MQTAFSVWKASLISWTLVPTGILCILVACWAVDHLIGLSSVSFPASVALLIFLFLALVISDAVLGNKRTQAIVRVIDIPAGFALRYINVFFTPSFVLLPLSPAICGVEVGKIIAVFLIGFVVVFIATAYLVRLLQLVFKASKRAIIERAEEMGAENDAIPLADMISTRGASSTTIASTQSAFPSTFPAVPLQTQDPSQIRSTQGPPPQDLSSITPTRILPPQSHGPRSRAQRWSAFQIAHLHALTFSTLFLTLGLTFYFSPAHNTALPAHLSLTVLTYFTALALPARYKQFLHPVLTSSALTIVGIWILALAKGDGLDDGLHAYKTGTRYLQLWSRERGGLPKPGAGDVLGSVLDVSIVALALPMFSFRGELKRHVSYVGFITHTHTVHAGDSIIFGKS